MRLVVAAALLIACACGETPTAPTTGELSVSGAVLSFTSQTPIAQTSVQFLSNLDTLVAATTTDASGRYSTLVPAPGEYLVRVNGSLNEVDIFRAGRVDLLYDDSGRCIARYGVITDVRTRLPIRGAQVTLGSTAITNGDGTYMIELGCPGNPTFGGTTFISVSHPDYATLQRVVGRGVSFVSRLDLALERD